MPVAARRKKKKRAEPPKPANRRWHHFEDKDKPICSVCHIPCLVKNTSKIRLNSGEIIFKQKRYCPICRERQTTTYRRGTDGQIIQTRR